MRSREIAVLTFLTIGLVTAEFSVASGQSVRGGAPPKTTVTAVGQPATVQREPDLAFVSHAAMANMAEIQMGRLATKNAQSDAVKKFASEMVADHIKVQNALAEAAMGAGVQWPKGLDDKHAASQARLSALKGPAFDREYMKAMIDGHREVEKTLAARTEGGRAANELAANVAEWTANTLPEVRAHLKKAEAIVTELQ